MEETRRKKLRRQNIISACILVVGIVLSFLLFGPKNTRSQTDQTSQDSRPAALVKTMVAGEEGTKVAILEKTATFSSSSEANVVTEYSGRITSVSFEVGSYVKEGQTLAYFDQSSDQNSPKINYDSAGTVLGIAQENLAKTQELNDENLELAKNARKVAELQLKQQKAIPNNSDQIKIAKRNLENAKDLEDQAEEQAGLSLNGARLQVSQAEMGLQNAKVAYEKTIIKAPISGLVISKNVEQDNYISAGTTVAHIAGGGDLQTTVSLSSEQIERIKSGDDVQIVIDGKEYIGDIVSFSPVANSQNQRFDVLIQSSEDLSSEANKSGQVKLKLYLDESKENLFFVPLEAVNIGQKKTIVFVVVDGKAVAKEVKTGEVIGTQIEIVEGLAKSDEVIVENSRNIQEGQVVNNNQ